MLNFELLVLIVHSGLLITIAVMFNSIVLRAAVAALFIANVLEATGGDPTYIAVACTVAGLLVVIDFWRDRRGAASCGKTGCATVDTPDDTIHLHPGSVTIVEVHSDGTSTITGAIIPPGQDIRSILADAGISHERVAP